MSNLFSPPPHTLKSRSLKRLCVGVAALTVLVSANAFAGVPYVKAEKPITDKDGRVKVIIDFKYDAHLKYPGALPVVPARDVLAKPTTFFLSEKTLALASDYERRYGFERTGMTSWVGNSVTAFVSADTVAKLLDDPLVTQVSDDTENSFSQMPAGGWQNTASGNEWTSWGHQAVNGKISTGNTGRKIYIIDGGVAYHDDLPSMVRRNVACGASGECAVNNPYSYSVVACYAHATHVAGIIGAIAGNGKTMKGAYAGFPNLVSLSVLTRTGTLNCGDTAPTTSAIGYALDYIAFDATQNNPNQLVHVATMSINPGGAFIYPTGQQGPNWQKIQSLTTTIWAYGVPVVPGVFFVQSSGNDGLPIPYSTCDWAYSPNTTNVASSSDGVMVVGASHHDGGAVTPNRPFSSFAPGASFPNYDSPTSTFPYSQGGTVTWANSESCVDIFAPGDLILSTWGIHANVSPVEYAGGVANTLNTPWMNYSGSVAFPVVYGSHSSTPAPTQGWAFLSGSSMAAPFVAAAAAWLADVYGYTTPGALEQAVRANITYAVDPMVSPPIPPVPVVRLP